MSLFFESRTGTDRRQIIILAHDGVNTDLVAETLEAVSNVEKLGAVIFAVTGNTRANAFALLGYAGSRDRLFVSAADRAIFQDSLDETLGVCESITSAVTTTSKNLRRRVHGVRGRRAKAEKNVFVPGQKCGFDKVDLTLVLDTSGSVFRVFEDQREIALNILDEIPVEAFSDAVQVSVTRFAAGADVILPFLKGRGVSEIKDAIKEVKFTGQNTRIAGAVEIALDEMERARRRDARQETKAELFAVSASQDYNEAELLIYIGDGSRGSSSCEVDLILIIDRSESVEGDFKKEIEDAKLELALGRYQRKEIAKALEGIVHTGGTTSSVEGARLAMQVPIFFLMYTRKRSH
ncbi:unnamed protein product [Haemonchus placei]|uniref:VWFA domain-containing protein n=1 Tax=Haemonchus placei TaxID=6290 RepID=A0A0N4WIL1_HAEPC|nr:unnamed protein product [Haemonchus placei]